MNFAQFQKTLAEAVRHRSATEIDVRLRTITKNNGIQKRAMEISGSAAGLNPSVYMEPYYEQYRSGVPVSHLADLVLEQCGSYRTKRDMPGNFFQHYQDVRRRMFCKLINYAKNQTLLEEVPHRRWKDLAMVCYYSVDPSILQDASILIRREHVLRWGIDETRMLDEAWQHTRSVMKPVFRTLGSALQEMNASALCEGEESPLYLLTNQNKTFGAVLIADPVLLHRIAARMESDFYILPSSVHECLILRREEVSDEELLLTMVREINRTQVSPQEVLSENLYYYDSAGQQLSVRTGEPDTEEVFTAGAAACTRSAAAQPAEEETAYGTANGTCAAGELHTGGSQKDI